MISTLFWYWIMTNPQVGWPSGKESFDRSLGIMAAPSLAVYIQFCWKDWFGNKGLDERTP
jgi:hypothetical protein